ncbi:unnamed protein product [Protopolystoma xenopodis]|uniref:Enoyl reductase (ER) domain-containing protein n=1 Tax=Protopolystoma xenopodis TaxID=117903 RepID=A0A3S5AWV5_9PLAT|nr:unnamed protein product [Protopolystoma xenopodis]
MECLRKRALEFKVQVREKELLLSLDAAFARIFGRSRCYQTDIPKVTYYLAENAVQLCLCVIMILVGLKLKSHVFRCEFSYLQVSDPVVCLTETSAWSERLVIRVPKPEPEPEPNVKSPEPESTDGANPVPDGSSTNEPPNQPTSGEVANIPPSTPTTPVCATAHMTAQPGLLLPWPQADQSGHGLTPSQAAGMAFAYLPAYLMIHRVANLRPGDVVLVYSAGGGVASFFYAGTRIALHLGQDPVLIV